MSFSQEFQDSINMMNHLDKELQSNNIKIQDLSAYLDLRRNQISDLQKHLFQQFQSIEKHKLKNIEIQNLVKKLLNQDLQKMKSLFNQIGGLLKKFFKDSQQFMVQSIYAQHQKFSQILAVKNNQVSRLQKELSRQKQTNFQLKKCLTISSYKQQKTLPLRGSSISKSNHLMKDTSTNINKFNLTLDNSNLRNINMNIDLNKKIQREVSKSRDHLILDYDERIKSQYSPHKSQKGLQSKSNMKNIIKQVQKNLREGYENRAPQKQKESNFIQRKKYIKEKIERMKSKPYVGSGKFH